jgi:hypothetical protein
VYLLWGQKIDHYVELLFVFDHVSVHGSPIYLLLYESDLRILNRCSHSNAASNLKENLPLVEPIA